jgi:hypothetical protein
MEEEEGLVLEVSGVVVVDLSFSPFVVELLLLLLLNDFDDLALFSTFSCRGCPRNFRRDRPPLGVVDGLSTHK